MTATPTRRRFNARLFRWHATARRPLLIRTATTPWEVLVAEVMSQQTGIERVGPMWRRFVDLWPSPAALAEASTRDLLAAWSGLGYNRRALALRDAARTIVAEHDGLVPPDVQALDALPGIGPYTARAVAAAAFRVPVAPLDVNVRRVISRVLGVEPSWPGLQLAADGMVSRGEPGRWFDAVMDLASDTCLPRLPLCDVCPLASVCTSRGAVVSVERKAAGPAFPTTSRWLRGRLVAVATAASVGDWVPLPERLGIHRSEAIQAAATRLEGEGFVELRDAEIRVRP